VRVSLRTGFGELRGLVALTWATATAAATTASPAAAAIRTGCAFADVRCVRPLCRNVISGEVDGLVEVGAQCFGAV